VTPFDTGVAMFAGVMALLVPRVPVGVAMLVAGGLGHAP
jgi:hypothetical protein